MTELRDRIGNCSAISPADFPASHSERQSSSSASDHIRSDENIAPTNRGSKARVIPRTNAPCPLSLTRWEHPSYFTAAPRFGGSIAAAAFRGGRSISPGQSTPAGQLVEKNTITRSYNRTVKDLSGSSRRSKKRQSPAARFATVAISQPVARAKIDAHCRKFALSFFSVCPVMASKLHREQF
jgi:hypothetical protein